MTILRKIAEEVLGEKEAKEIWSRIEIIGDIALIRRKFDYPIEKLRVLGEALLERTNVKAVWAVEPGTIGAYRLHKLVHLAGEKRTETVYKEHGYYFKVDVEKVFITTRLNYEHKRIAELANPWEVVINMFAGAGLFSIIMAKKVKKVYSIDISPYAYYYMLENVKLNKVEDKVIPIFGDAARVIEEWLKGVADRVLMPLPELALEYLPYALKALRCCGWIHLYLHVFTPKGMKAEEVAKYEVLKALKALGAEWEVRFTRLVRTVGPRQAQVVLDLFVRKSL